MKNILVFGVVCFYVDNYVNIVQINGLIILLNMINKCSYKRSFVCQCLDNTRTHLLTRQLSNDIYFLLELPSSGAQFSSRLFEKNYEIGDLVNKKINVK